MRTFVLVLQMVIRVLWVVNLVLGILFATGNLLGLVMLHETFGILIAICLLLLSVFAIARGRAVGLAAAGIVVAILLPVVGEGQLHVLTGSNHWVVEVVHVLVAIAAIGIAEPLGLQLRRSLAARGPAAT